MDLTVYNGEIFERSKLWYIWFSIIFASILIISLLYNNIPGAIIIFFLLGGYFYYSTNTNKKTKITLLENGVKILDSEIMFINITGYALEVNKNDGKIKNIVIITNKMNHIHTISDELENLKSFIENLNNYIPMLSEYPQTGIEKLSRRLKL